MLTHEQLNISEREFIALQEVRNMLNFKNLKYIDRTYADCLAGSNGFSMNVRCVKYECGSVACIGGWVWCCMYNDAIVKKNGLFLLTRWQAERADHYVDRLSFDRTPLADLYFPPIKTANYDKITSEQAATAIDNFPEIGTPDWEVILEIL